MAMGQQEISTRGQQKEPDEPFVLKRVVSRAFQELKAHPHPMQPRVQRKKQSVQVGDGAFVDYWVEGPSDVTYMMLFLKDHRDGEPIPQFKKPLCSVDFDPRDFQRAVGSFFRGPNGPKGALAPLAPSAESVHYQGGWDGHQNPFKSLQGIDVIEEPKKPTPRPLNKKKVAKQGRRRNRKLQPLDTASYNLRATKRLLAVW